jgi:hypothetical protein
MNRPPLQVVVDEVYPPHFSGRNARLLEMIGKQSFGYPGSEGTSEHREYGIVSYLRISCRESNSKRGEMVVIVCRSEISCSGSDSETDMEVRLTEWPHNDCASLADCAFRGHTHDRKTRVAPILGPGVEGKEFGNFIVEHSRDYINFFARREANGKSGKVTERSKGKIADLMVEEVGSDCSEDSGDLGVHGLFDHSRTTVTGSPSRNATTISRPNASDYDTRDAENDSGGNQVDDESNGKNEEDSDYLWIKSLFV